MAPTNSHAKSSFKKIVKILKLTPRERDRAWNRMVASGIEPHDPVSILVVMSAVLEDTAGLVDTWPR